MFENVRKLIALTILPGKKGALSPYQVMGTQPADIPVYTPMTVRRATREGYKISVYVYRAVRTIVQAASAIPWVVHDGNDEVLENHPFTKVWSKPNSEFSGQDNMEFIIAHQLLVGNSLIQPIIVNGKPREFWVVMPDVVRPIPSKVQGEWLKGWQVISADGTEQIVPAEQFIHFMQMDPGNPYWGTSPLIAAARTIDTDNEAQDTQKISMQNRAISDGAFTFEVPLDTEQFEEARRRVRERFLDKSRRGEPWVVGAGSKWQQMSMTPVEMDFMASRLRNKQDVAAAFGLDPWWLGDRSGATYNNVLEARRALYEDVAIPLLDDIKSTLNLKIAPMYGDIIITYDTSKVVALRADHKKQAETAKIYFDMGVPFDQINSRLEMGFDEFEGWDTGYLPMMIQPIGASAPEEEPKGMMTKALNLDSEEQKTAHWKRIDRRRVAWWGVVAKKMEPLYKDEAKAIAKAIEGKKPEELVRLAGRAITGGRGEWEKVLTAVLSALIEDFGNEIAEDLGAEKAVNPTERKWTFNPMSAVARAWIIKHGAESVTSILATNLDDVKRVILAGVDENVGTAKIARNLRQYYSDHSPFKAMRVARTETASASGFGQREAAKQSGVVKTKKWLSSRDARVRDSHAAIDGEEQPLNESYSNGLMYPGDPSGSTAEFIMCRCVESYQTGR